MKALPRVQDDQLQPGKFYIGARNSADGHPCYTDDVFYGPVGGLQVTYDMLRDPSDGETLGFLGDDGFWQFDMWSYSDLWLVYIPPTEK